MSGPHDESSLPSYDEQIDAILNRAMTGILTSLDSGFDPDAGLADIYARSRAATSPASALPEQPASARQAERPEDQPAQAAATQLAAVCQHIDALGDCLAFIITSAQAQPFPGIAYLEMARPVLAQLRRGLANRVLARNDAEQLVDNVQSIVGQADSIVRRQDGRTLAQAIHATAGELAEFGGPLDDQLRSLHQKVIRLYADSGFAASIA